MKHRWFGCGAKMYRRRTAVHSLSCPDLNLAARHCDQLRTINPVFYRTPWCGFAIHTMPCSSNFSVAYDYKQLSKRSDNDDVRSTRCQYRLWPCNNHILAASEGKPKKTIPTQCSVMYGVLWSNNNHWILTGKSKTSQCGGCWMELPPS